jgi:hypothetical protein
MLAFPEMLKNLTPVRRLFTKGSPARKHFFERLADLLAIVVSIYLALSIEGWAEKRIEHKRLQQYYHNMTDELAKDTVSLHETIADAEMHISSTKSHMRLLRTYNPSLQDTVSVLFRGMLTSQLFYSSEMISYKSMVLSGEIRLIENLKVRDKLIELEGVYTSLKVYEDMYLEFITKDLTKAFSNSFDYIDNRLTDKGYFTKTEYRNLVATFYSHNTNRMEQYRMALLKARETLEIIQHELGEKK